LLERLTECLNPQITEKAGKKYNNGLTNPYINCMAYSDSIIFAGTMDGGIFKSTKQ
jgi:hypothetical protein